MTLIELIMFMVIVGVAAAGIMGVLSYAGKQSADPARRKQAMMIAEALMEEVQLARFTYCEPNGDNASTATSVGDCANNTRLTVSGKNGLVRPYATVADYATALNTQQRSFAPQGVGADRDVSGRALGTDAGGAQMGNASLAGITTTVELNILADATQALNGLQSTAADLAVLRITIRTTYGTGANDFIRLDGYRTRYAPNFVP